MPQPFPTHCDNIGSQPDRTPSGWIITRAVAVRGLTDVMVANFAYPDEWSRLAACALTAFVNLSNIGVSSDHNEFWLSEEPTDTALTI
jgi:hypothetical protein